MLSPAPKSLPGPTILLAFLNTYKFSATFLGYGEDFGMLFF